MHRHKHSARRAARYAIARCRTQPHARAMEERPLFGGAVVAALPATFIVRFFLASRTRSDARSAAGVAQRTR
jgi:hypothetical protein